MDRKREEHRERPRDKEEDRERKRDVKRKMKTERERQRDREKEVDGGRERGTLTWSSVSTIRRVTIMFTTFPRLASR